MAKKKNGKVKGFVLTFIEDRGLEVTLSFDRDHQAEQVLRGLIHAGYSVTIGEKIFDMPERLKEVYDFDSNAHEIRLVHGAIGANPDEDGFE